ncbi:tetratricopeptide repeat-containing sulfotransferase family protein [Lacimicrobium alkaliphilum]|uniref:tetratricopeptide repeat-containing sulfotransferase family protein n=1 Tax=Lacimicrobium alkaliphilum TaxID=1526571 RepID=UPI0018D20142|nr:tetratricopeptide repeat-containing sulfotransferase family protein [Lacimicrobium alkaliphilum]
MENEIKNIVSLCQQAKWQSALDLCQRSLHRAEDSHKHYFSELLAEIYMAMGLFKEAETQLLNLTTDFPHRLDYVQQLADLYAHQRETDKGVHQYQRFLRHNPDNANAHFNLALLYKKQMQFDKAEAAYQKALALNIEQPEEVHTNLAVMYSERRREHEAEASLRQALKINPDYVPALFNLATLFEEFGIKEQATGLYQQILQHQPDNVEVMARLVQSEIITPEKKGVLENLESVLKHNPALTQLHKEAGYFALGKGHDDLAEFDIAFTFYNKANQLCSKRLPPYNAGQIENQVQETIGTFDSGWVQKSQTSSDFAPVFICGMFRSGTTLLEQILSAHPRITSGGELGLLKHCIERLVSDDFTDGSPSATNIQALSEQYQNGLGQLFAKAEIVTDKRPDNFWHLGLVRAAFPKAKIICTDRHPLDICLSVYFQHLGNELSYSASLNNTAHYYTQYKKLLRHWISLMPENVYCVDYQQLVMNPEKTIRMVLEFCELPWSDDCMQFHQSKAVVKTASIWQVRQPLYQSSLDRWCHYKKHFQQAREILAEELEKVSSDSSEYD